ncbi:DUF3876 domain-containing protein [Dysgonomonas sp. OttesenSCG-928-D17]|nr:DUF3876 domain-containing protein [Dysgonomonas sp. OttesenSCG-928-D17]
MYSKGYIPAQCVDSNFRMADLQGHWKSSFGSPEVKVVRYGNGYRITYSYSTGVSITTRIFRYGGTVFFNLYGWIAIYYDPLRDVLTLSTEGDYYRVEE